MDEVTILLYAFSGALFGSFISSLIWARAYAKRMAKRYQEQIYEYLKREEEVLNHKIKRSNF